MKIALLGYGKMGKVIERIALEHGHEIVLRKTSTSTFDGLADADVAIDFSVPDAALDNITAALEHDVPVISGTTGWLQDYEKVTALCQSRNGAFIYGSNFSLGVNIFFSLNQYLASVMARFPEYKVSLEEIHHVQKLDAPSGTAITLANDIIAQTEYTGWTLDDPKPDQLPIVAHRLEYVPGTHDVIYTSMVDTIEIKHTAHNRNGFALGAVIAAEWIIGKQGVFTMKDVLDLK